MSSQLGGFTAPAFQFGQGLAGYSPQFGILPSGSRGGPAGPGVARALPFGLPGKVALPVLLAVLMLSAASGALVRTWVLRRADPYQSPSATM